MEELKTRPLDMVMVGPMTPSGLHPFWGIFCKWQIILVRWIRFLGIGFGPGNIKGPGGV